MVDRVAKRFVALGLAFLFLCSGIVVSEHTPAKAESAFSVQWARDTLKSLGYQDVYGIQNALEYWLVKTAWADEKHQTILLTLPNMKKLGTKGLPQYQGQEPVGYLMRLRAAMARQIIGAPSPKPVEMAASSMTDMNNALRTFTQNADEYVTGSLRKVQAYKALSRICMPLSKAETFQGKQFVNKTDAPLFKKNFSARKALEKGLRGAAVQDVQQALIDRGYMQGQAKSLYDDAMVKAVAAFLKDQKMEGDGTKLTLDAQTVLLGREDTYNALMEILARELTENWSVWSGGEELDTVEEVTPLVKKRFPIFLRTISQAKWSLEDGDLGLSYSILPLEDLEETWVEQKTEQYMSLKVAPEGMEDELIRRISSAWTNVKDDEEEAESGTLYLDFADPSLAIAHWAEDFLYFNDAYEEILSDLDEYMDTNPAPLPMPKNKVLKKPGSGGSRFAVRNGGEDPIYVRIYKMKGASDTGKGKYVGSAFVSANGKVSMSIAPGYYRVTYGSGPYWYGEKKMFGEDGFYKASEDIYKFENRYIHTLSLRVENGGGKSVDYNDITPDDM
jgi:hypothetical protein